jgi:hypothetical protein
MRIKITESQLERIKSSLTEGPSDKYNKIVNIKFNAYGDVKFNGMEINDISDVKIRLYYTIEIDARSWGIKDISLYSIDGPEEIETEIDFYVDEDNTNTQPIKFKLNWDAVELEEESEAGIVSIADDVEVELVNDNQGNLVVKSIKVVVYTL